MFGVDTGDAAGIAATDAIQPLAALPVAFKLRGRRVALAGGGDGAAWKAELLSAAGARVDVYAEAALPRMIALAGRRPEVTVHARTWRPDDIDGAALAILDTPDDAEAEAFRAAARAAGVPVNVVDRPEFCDFSFATLVNRSPLTIAISTDGAAPVFGQAIRARLEALLPPSFGLWAQAAREWRGRVSGLGLDFRQRRSFWERFAELALKSGERGPQEADLEALSQAQDQSQAPSRGRLVLVGAGPGDPDLLTMKAVRALQSADVVMFDHLASGGVLELARREARRIDVGKRAGRPSPSQSEITQMAVSLAGEGRTVVRLKGGDPGVFGRANEEIRAARAAGVDVEIIPGVTAAFAAAAELGVSLSDKHLARRIQFVTAHDPDGALPDGLDWSALADPDATTAVYMGARQATAFVQKLLEAGLARETPAILCENVSRADARKLRSPLSELPARIAAEGPWGPTLLLYGRALTTDDAA